MKKIPKDVLKRRRNYRLKKMLTPKPPMMVLFELVQHTEIVFDPYISDPVNYQNFTQGFILLRIYLFPPQCHSSGGGDIKNKFLSQFATFTQDFIFFPKSR